MSNTYRIRGSPLLVSMMAIPFDPRCTPRFMRLFHTSKLAQAVASGRWA
ncbi:hypothetical protein [Acutalibacter sp. 1XD8-33]|nr:hypothetical protein [Acutalibacter sp. 1XD8-33]